MFGCFLAVRAADHFSMGKIFPNVKDSTLKKVCKGSLTIDSLGVITFLVLGILTATHILPFSSTALFAAGGGIAGFDLLAFGTVLKTVYRHSKKK